MSDASLQAILAAARKGQFVAALELADAATVTAGEVSDRLHAVRAEILARLGRTEDALAAYEKAIAISPDNGRYRLACALVCVRASQFEAALTHLDSIRRPVDRSAEFFVLRSNVLRNLKRFDDALLASRQALRQNPSSETARISEVMALLDVQDMESAHKSLQPLLAKKPVSFTVRMTEGKVMAALGRHSQALDAYQKANRLNPKSGEALVGVAVALRKMNQNAQALEYYKAAIKVEPLNPEVRWNTSLALLSRGDYELGWKLYESRFQCSFFKKNLEVLKSPQWTGSEDVSGRTVLLLSEQGYGDTIQFCRYAPMLKARGARVVLKTQEAVRRLLGTLNGVDEVVPNTPVNVAVRAHSYLMSLPAAFGTTVETVPDNVPYLSAVREDVYRFAVLMNGMSASCQMKIGLAWSGNPEHKNDVNRSMRLVDLANLLELPHAWVQLQKGVRDIDLQSSTYGKLMNFEGEIRDFADTAALIENLDLVISVDTSIAHLAGALGKPVWVMLPTNPDFRWMLEREDTPWYPSMKLFRQTRPGDWSDVVRNISAELAMKTTPLQY